MSNKSGTSSQVISLPEGGGALSGIGETFAPDLHTGTGNFSIPIALPPGRNGFQPELNLVYSTGNGNGPFGLGWNLSVPGVSRKTAKGVPRYHDYDPNQEPDVFILSGAEDLVPVEEQPSGATRYQPRTEGLFALIDHHHDSQNNYWEVKSKDGLVSIYGTRRPPGAAATWQDPAVISDPVNREKIYSWHLTETKDPFGNRIVYKYSRELDQSPENPPHHHWDQLYLEQIQYCAYMDESEDEQFLVSINFEYEARPDAFSHYLSGFEIRTTRRCNQITVRTQPNREELARFYQLDPNDPTLKDHILVRTYELGYQNDTLNGVSMLSRIEVAGIDESRLAGDQRRTLPPLEFSYTGFDPQQHDFFPVKGREQPMRSLANPDLELADLFGNGLPDIIQMNGVVRYWRNLGNGEFDIPRLMKTAPAGVSLADPEVQLMDADGDGRIDLVVNQNGLAGYFPLNFNGEWDRRSFQRQNIAPSFSFADPEVQMVDLNGDGVTDVIRSGSRMECFFNDPKEGWNDPRFVERRDLDEFPNVNFSDPRVRWADMTGDGLQDIILVYDGNIEYWPNLGHGNWGNRIHMFASPRLPYGYDPRRILIGDVDGDGLADVVYVDHCKVHLWINQSGNGWSKEIVIEGTPPLTDVDAVRLVDLLGTGVPGILWSRDATLPGRDHFFYLNFTGGVKPYVLNEMNNHMGAITRVEYAPSTRFYMADAQNPQTRWQTPLPFPVQVVACVEVIDEISKGKLTTEYRYHHGYWDGTEREFRGFGMVEQVDTETFDRYNATGLHDESVAFDAVAEQHFSPPMLSKTWFHQGPIGDEFGTWGEVDYSREYWDDDPPVLGDLRPNLTAILGAADTQLQRRIKRDALRTLRGSILRTELYALDGSDRENRPYTVTESQFDVRAESVPAAGDDQRLPIFFPHPVAQRTTQWERGDEPMTSFSFTDDYDDYGQPRRQIALAVPRRRDFRVPAPAIEPYPGTVSTTTFAQPDEGGRYIVDRVASSTAFEIINDGSPALFGLVQDVRSGAAQLEPFGQSFNYYDGDAFEGLSLGQLGDFGALVRSEVLVLTEDILRDVYRDETDPNAPDFPPYLAPDGIPNWNDDEYPQEFRGLTSLKAGYDFADGSDHRMRGYFVQSARTEYDFQDPDSASNRGLPLVMRDPLGSKTTIVYDNPFQVFPTAVVDGVGLTTTAEYDYRVMQPNQVTDPNGNVVEFTFTRLGLLHETFVRGKRPDEGDTQRPSIRLEYDFLAFVNSPPNAPRQPISVRTIQQEHHDTETDIDLPERDATIESIEFSDGFGRLVQTRSQAEDVLFGDTDLDTPLFGNDVLPADQNDSTGTQAVVVGRQRDPNAALNVVVSGWQIYDNKGQVIEKFEPFFSQGFDYLSPEDEQKRFQRDVLGRKVTMFYDPRGQVIHTLNPDGSEQRVIYGVPGTILNPDLTNPDLFEPTPWEAYTYDANDLASISQGPQPDGTIGSLTDRAPAHHHFTPANIVIDALGRTVLATARNRNAPGDVGDPLPQIEEYHTRSTYDIRGNLLTVTDALGREAFTYRYDLADNPLRIENIDAGVRRVILDVVGNEIERRDSKGALILQGYDILHRVIRMWARDDRESRMTLRERMVYGDDGNSNQSLIEREANRQINRLGQLQEYFDEAGLLTFEAYDFKGNLLEKVRQVIRDDAILAVFPEPADPNPDWNISAFRVDWQPPLGLTLAQHATNLLDAAEFRTAMTYDALNRVKTMRYPQDVDGERKQLRPQYNRAGGLEQVWLGDEVYVERIAYNAKGQRSLIALGNGIMTRYAYDPHTFRLSRLRSERYSQTDGFIYQPASGLLQDFAYGYDLMGNIVAIHARTPDSGIPNTPMSTQALDRDFGYDAIYRLTLATGREHAKNSAAFPWDERPKTQDITLAQPYIEAYEYDPVGNMTRLRHSANVGDFTRRFEMVADPNDPTPLNNRLAQVTIGNTDFDYTYDANGNMTDETTSRHFEWDHSDQMKAYCTQIAGSEPTIHAHYLYDAGGQRVKKLVRRQGGSFETTTYVDSVFEHHRWGDGAGEQNNHLHVMDDQQRIALFRVGPAHPEDRGPVVRYHLGDHLGSSNIVVNQDGSFINREEHTPHGETSFGSFAKKHYRFTGRERDEESGLNYHSARYYAHALARWINPDPLGSIDGPNLYLFVHGNPLKFTDFEGTQAQATSGTSEDVQRHFLEEGVEKLEVSFGNAYKEGLHPGWEFNDFWEGGRAKNGAPYKIATLRPTDRTKPPSRALWKLVENSDSWSLECAQFVQILKNYQALRILGPEKFDEVIQNSNQRFSLRPFRSTAFTNPKVSYKRNSKSGSWRKIQSGRSVEINLNTNELLDRIPTGSRVLFRNEKGKGSYFNENTILIKRNNRPNQFVAHGFGERKVFSKIQIQRLLYEIVDSRAPLKEAKNHVWIKEIAVYENPKLIYQKMANGGRSNGP